jgi:UDP-N-acetylglucosamine--N-acetylmuramyl-(pentapeptide) pyrophosphoryl-undecaprenol N-acetylglucosamine transferase
MEHESFRGETRVVLAGGGTGGHIFAGKAIVEALNRRRPFLVMFVGTRRGMEEKALQEENMKLEYIDISGLKGLGLRGLFRAAVSIPRSLRQSLRILRNFQPHLAIGLGGYSAGPVLWQATRLKIATLIVEPNAFPGATNRWLKRRVDAAAVAFEETRQHLGKNCQVTGVPVRREFFSSSRTVRNPGRFRLLVFGGSQGSHRINQWITEALPVIKSNWEAPRSILEIVHQTGRADYAWVVERYRKLGIEADVRPFIDNMPQEMGYANLLVTRSGAGTVGELCAAGRVSILIPFAQAADQHQLHNARILEKHCASFVMEEKEVTCDKLAGRILAMAAQPQMLTRMEEVAQRLARPDAADRIANVACELLERRAA